MQQIEQRDIQQLDKEPVPSLILSFPGMPRLLCYSDLRTLPLFREFYNPVYIHLEYLADAARLSQA